MSDSDSPSSGGPGKAAAKHPGGSRLLVAGIGIAAAIALFVILSGQHSNKQTPVLINPQPVISQTSETVDDDAPTVVREKPQPIKLTAVAVAPEAESASPEPLTVDHAIIPADHSGPPWALNLMSLSNLNGKPEHLDEITALGYTPEVIEVNIDGRHWLRLRIKGFATIAAARKAGEKFIDNKEYRTLWVGGYK